MTDQLFYAFKKPWKVGQILQFRLALSNKLSMYANKRESSILRLKINNKVPVESIDQFNNLFTGKMKLEEELKDYFDLIDGSKLKSYENALRNLDGVIQSFKLDKCKALPEFGAYYQVDPAKTVIEDKEFISIKIITTFGELSDFSLLCKDTKLLAPTFP